MIKFKTNFLRKETICMFLVLIVLMLVSSATVYGADDVLKVRAINGSDITTMDPAYYLGDEELNIDLSFYSKLIRFKAGSSEWELDAAEEFEVSDDGKVIEFKLKEGIQFHHGYGELTTEDVKFSFERIADPDNDSPYHNEWATLEEVEIIDKYRGRIILSEPYAPLFTQTLPYNPGSIISKEAYQDRGDNFATNPVGSGPYYWENWDPGEKITLARFEDYHGELPDFRRIEIFPISEVRMAEIALDAGELNSTQISYDSFDIYNQRADINVEQVAVTSQVFLGFNMQEEPFTDKNVRKAIRYAVNVDEVIQGAYNNIAERANSSIVESVLGHWEDAPQYDPDLEKAREYLAKAGYEDGFKTELVVPVREPLPEVGQIIRQQLLAIGIDAKIQMTDSSYDYLSQSRSNMHIQDWGPTLDPDRWTKWWHSEHVGSWNFKNFTDPDYDRLVEEAVLELDQEKRHQLYVEQQKILDEEVSAVWISHGAHLQASQDHIKPVFFTQRSQYRYWEIVE
ncbi:ABC transporter substrate-binding protein [Halanaerobium hydrogeniformans]|uniref:Extracellular solute-binding protein family 5 n=1 Tax=Halanaerobium hydrogeniformans TaxID=656519 RepID=E4RJQ0_HALHG|nr:ABC transporter substrate-binding protein [Halanaerobium hydrogeniformans]ADQ15470.1 extracellular solute-binding protein family 5 [Halanaerobium hydrogeniformans]